MKRNRIGEGVSGHVIDTKICNLGTGNMGEALVSGLVHSGSARPEDIICTDVREERLAEMRARYGVRTSTDNLEAVAASEVVIYAVKPQLMAEVLKETSDLLDMSKLIISIAAGVPLRAIESLLHKELRLIRVMPNIAAWSRSPRRRCRPANMPRRKTSSSPWRSSTPWARPSSCAKTT